MKDHGASFVLQKKHKKFSRIRVGIKANLCYTETKQRELKRGKKYGKKES